MKRIQSLQTYACALSLALGVTSASGEPYPEKPVRLIVPFGAGSASDLVARLFADEVGKRLGQSVIVDNRAGATSIIGTDACAKSPPNGYVICVLPTDAVVITPLLRKVPYDVERDLQPIAGIGFFTLGLMTSPALGVESLAEFTALARARPKEFNYGAVANLSILFMDGFNRASGTAIQSVPFKGGAEAATALMGGQVQALMMVTGNSMPLIKSGKIKLLATDGESRSPMFPNVPTFSELKYRGPLLRASLGVFGPAGIPSDVVVKINAAFNSVGQLPEIRQRVFLQGIEPAHGGTEEFASQLKQERALAKRLIQESGLKIE